MKILISIIVVNYNGEKFLHRLFQSINQQTFKNYEVILIDNSSQDGSVEYVKRNFSKTKIFVKNNSGYGSACNFGAKKTKGQYLVFLNEDMYLPKNFLKSMISFYERVNRNNKVGGISCKMVDFDKDPKEMPNKYGGQIDLFGFSINRYYKDDIFIISGCPFFINKKVFIKIKGFNDSIFLYGEDVDLSWRLKIFGYKNYMNHDTYLHHFGGGASGGFGPRKVALNLCVSLIPMYTNYSTITFWLIFPLLIMYTFMICVAIFFVKFKIEYFLEVIRYYLGFLKNFKKTNKLRMFVQKNRVYNDIFIFKYVSLVPAFIYNSSYKKLSHNYKITNG